MAGQRQARTGQYSKMNINVPTNVYEFIKTCAHAKNLSISAYVTQVFVEKKDEILSGKS